jgi:hypothetical protein
MPSINFTVNIEVDGLSDDTAASESFDEQLNTLMASMLSAHLISGYVINRGSSGWNPIVANS